MQVDSDLEGGQWTVRLRSSDFFAPVREGGRGEEGGGGWSPTREERGAVEKDGWETEESRDSVYF